MSSSQVNYPDKIILKGKGINIFRNLNKGPQKENIQLEPYMVKLKRNDQALQPVLMAGITAKIESLTFYIPLTEKWTPLIHGSYCRAFTSLFLYNKNRSAVLQVCQNPKTPGLVKIELSGNGKMVVLSWIIGRSVKVHEELTLPTVHFSQNEGKITPMRYSFKERDFPSLNRGRLLTFPGNPTLQRVSHDLKALSSSGLTFDFYLLDYGIVPVWGDWTNLIPGFAEKIPSLINEIRRNGMIPGICLAPLAAEKKSPLAQNGFIPGKGVSRTIKVGDRKKRIYPLDITREEVRTGLKKTLDLYTGWGFKSIHLDHLDLLLYEGSWQDELLGPLDRFRLLTGILEPYQKKGISFSASGLPLMGGLESFDVISPFMLGRKGHFSRKDWQDLSLVIEIAMNVKNPPLLSLGGQTFFKEKKKSGCRQNKICHDSQVLLNGPAILAEEFERLDTWVRDLWKDLALNKKPNVLPLDFSPLGLSQDVLLLINRQKNVAIYNFSEKKKVVRLLEGELGDYKGLSPSHSTALRSQELILSMRPESSHLFQA